MTPISRTARRALLLASGAAAGLLLAGCDQGSSLGPFELQPKEVTPDEELMREHGVLRRCLLVYAECAVRLRRNPTSVPANALRDTGMLFRRFGEDYHERTLEERFVFPALRQAGGAAARYVDVLVAQHNRGREITDFVLRTAGQGRVAASAAPLAAALSAFAWMYENHASREDTVVFPAWKAALSPRQYEEAAGQFERLEREVFGEDGFRDAVSRIAAVEEALGMADIAQFTAPMPPASL